MDDHVAGHARTASSSGHQYGPNELTSTVGPDESVAGHPSGVSREPEHGTRSEPPFESFSTLAFAPPFCLPPPPTPVRPEGTGPYLHLVDRVMAGDPLATPEWKAVVGEMMDHIPDYEAHGLGDELREAARAGFGALRECTRLFASLPFLAEDAESYRELAHGVQVAVERLRDAHLRVDIRLRRGGATGALLALVNDALTVRANAPLDPPHTPAEYAALLHRLELLWMPGSSDESLFQRRDGIGIGNAILQELALIPVQQGDGPVWIDLHFKQQQQLLLKGLWGRGLVSARELKAALSYERPETADGSLERTVTRTNSGLGEKAPLIGSCWTITQRTVARVKHYLLERLSPTT